MDLTEAITKIKDHHAFLLDREARADELKLSDRAEARLGAKIDALDWALAILTKIDSV